MRAWRVLPLCLTIAAAPAPDPGARIGLHCQGTEMRRDGAAAPVTRSYEAQLSIDLAARRFCMESCTRDRSFPIVDPIARPIRLIESRIPGQSRLMLFDPATMQLTDEQHLAMATQPAQTRSIRAHCVPAPFRQPPEPKE